MEDHDVYRFYDGSVYVVREYRDVQGVLSIPYHNVRVKGDLKFVVHPNLSKPHVYSCTPSEDIVSAPTDIVVSRNQSSVRFGDLTYMTSKGDVRVSKTLNGSSPDFEKPVDKGLGVHYVIESNSVMVYVDNQAPSCKSRGVRIVASNFMSPDVVAEGLGADRPKEEHTNRDGYTQIEPDENGHIENIHVRGSMVVDYYVHLNKVNAPLGWFSGKHSQRWYQPHGTAVTREIQEAMAMAKPDDMVISRGTASVLIDAYGNIHSSGPVCVFAIQGVPFGPTVVFG